MYQNLRLTAKMSSKSSHKSRDGKGWVGMGCLYFVLNV